MKMLDSKNLILEENEINIVLLALDTLLALMKVTGGTRGGDFNAIYDLQAKLYVCHREEQEYAQQKQETT